jgi:hypothetical protein
LLSLQRTAGNHAVARLVEGGGARLTRAKWATKATKKEAQEIAAGGDPIYAAGQTTHHKVPQTNMERLLEAALAAGAEAEPLFTLLDERIAERGGSDLYLRQLLNFPANLEVGPHQDIRVGDPGPVFDPDVTGSGSLTPRSVELEAVDAAIVGGQPIDFAEVARRLERAQELHDEISGGHLLSDPLIEQWIAQPGGGFKRRTPRSQPPPVHNPPRERKGKQKRFKPYRS